MSTIDPDFLKKLKADTEQTLTVIIRVSDDAEAHKDDVEARGLSVMYTYTLISGLAARGKAEAILTLAHESWVIRIEPDQILHTQ